MRSFNFSKSMAIIAFFVSSMFLVSCSDDEPAAAPAFSFAIENYSINNGLVFDYGPVNFVDYGDPTHYNYDFIVHDGSYDTSDDSFQGSFLLASELLSPGTTDFQAGTFSYMLPDVNAQVAGEFYFNSIALFVDANGNNRIFETEADESEDHVYFATGGTIVVTNNGADNYTLDYNLTFVRIDFITETFIDSTEITVEFSVSLHFEVHEISLEGRRENSGLLSVK